MNDNIVGFEPDEVQKQQKNRFGQALKEFNNEEVTIDNFENFIKRLKSNTGSIKDDIQELKKKNKKIEKQMQSKKDAFDETFVDDIRENDYDLKFLSIDVEDTLAYRKYRNLELIETKRAYRTAHWRLATSKLVEILKELKSTDQVVKKRIESATAEILKEVSRTEEEIVDTVEQQADSLAREHGQIQRYQKTSINLSQELSQHISVQGIDLPKGQSVQGNEEDEEKEQDGDEENLSDSGDVSAEDDREFELRDKSIEEQKKVLDKMVREVEDIEALNKSEIVEMVDLSRQGLYYTGDQGGVIGKVEEEYSTEYPELH